jgi:hypothetical protein
MTLYFMKQHGAVRLKVKTLFRLGAKFDIEDGKGKAPLHVSAESGSYNVAKFMVECQETF